MKEFDHPHVAKLVGELLLRGGRHKIRLKPCSQRWEGSVRERGSALSHKQADGKIVRRSWLKSAQTPDKEFSLQALYQKPAREGGRGDREDAPEIWGQPQSIPGGH